MADTKEFESLDELFRKTFDNLPEAPAASGWDTPSERVWQYVQTQVKPPKSGWSNQAITLIAAFAVTLAVGLYLFFAQENTQAPTLPTASVPTPPATEAIQQTQEKEDQVAVIQPVVPKVASLPAKKATRKKSSAPDQKAVPETVFQGSTADEAAKEAQADSSTGNTQKSPGKKPVSPNTTERRKAELAKRAEEAWKKALQPLPQRWPRKPN